MSQESLSNLSNLNNSNNLGSKVFVGNVPYQCTRDEFKECFLQLDGFIMADIIRRHKSKLSRGFGFVVFDTENNAKKLLDVGEINLKNRTLRFSEYEKSVNQEQPQDKSYQIFVKDLDDDVTHEKLRRILENDSFDIVSCFVTLKNDKMFGIVNLDNYETYAKILKNPPVINGKKMNLTPYKNYQKKNPHFVNVKVAYQEGFRSGQSVGFQQGLEHKKNITDYNNGVH
jgi:RNA recognition motif-containing protein